MSVSCQPVVVCGNGSQKLVTESQAETIAFDGDGAVCVLPLTIEFYHDLRMRTVIETDVDLIVFMRTTHSRRIFVQQIGRGLRISPNKDKVVVLDFVTDLRRIAELIELEKASTGPLERLPLGPQLVRFRDESAGSFMLEWMKDQAELMLREGDPQLELPQFDFPKVSLHGGVE